MTSNEPSEAGCGAGAGGRDGGGVKSDDRGKRNMTEVAEVSVGPGFPW